MKYRVIWDDWEDGRTGESLEVNACSPKEAYFIAVKELQSFARRFQPCDIECLVDEHGNYHRPEIFLKE